MTTSLTMTLSTNFSTTLTTVLTTPPLISTSVNKSSSTLAPILSLNVFNSNQTSGTALLQILDIFQQSTYDISGCLIQCSNNGQCTFDPIAQKYVCECNPYFSGTGCERDLRLCESSSSPCLNNGTCISLFENTSYSFVCDCTSGFRGVNCENSVNMCANLNCSSHGYCIAESNTGVAKCKCLVSYSGEHCEIEESSVKLTHGVQIVSVTICVVFFVMIGLLVILNDVGNKYICKQSKVKKNKKLKKKSNKMQKNS